MNLSDIRFPRQLEADETVETIHKTLMARTVKLWSGVDLDVARITMNNPLKKVLQKARLMGPIRCGLEAVFARLASERTPSVNAIILLIVYFIIDSYYYKKEIDIFGLCSKEIFLEHHLESGYSLNIENE